MTGVNDKLDRLLEDVAATKEHVELLETQIAELKSNLAPVFFQTAAIKFSGIALGGSLAVLTCLSAMFPELFASMAKLLVGALVKGAL